MDSRFTPWTEVAENGRVICWRRYAARRDRRVDAEVRETKRDATWRATVYTFTATGVPEWRDTFPSIASAKIAATKKMREMIGAD